jgi:hypothetical protein
MRAGWPSAPERGLRASAEAGRSGHSPDRPARGNAVDSGFRNTHDEGMRPIPLRDSSVAVRAGTLAATVQDLEEFWPSRRSHAYDEFCR